MIIVYHIPSWRNKIHHILKLIRLSATERRVQIDGSSSKLAVFTSSLIFFKVVNIQKKNCKKYKSLTEDWNDSENHVP